MPLFPLRLALLLLAAATALLAVGCASSPTATATALPTRTPTPSPTHTPTPTPEPLVFLPADESPHDTPIEWWYFNGMLRDDEGGEYSYHFVTFQSEGPPGVVPHLLQASLGDHGRGIHHTAETGLLEPERPDARGVDVETGGWLMTGGEDGYDMRFGFDGDKGAISVELRAVPERPPVLQGGTGLVHMGPEAGSTYYYSRTRLDVTGWIEDADGRRPVRGPAWMDHQWGEIASNRVGWDWASVQLDDGSDLMAAVVWHPDGRRRLAAHGTFVSAGGEAVTYFEDDAVSMTGQGSWTSPDTGVEYPVSWRVEVGEIELELAPFLEQSEFNSDILSVAYWEGAVSVTGSVGDRAVSGWGFVELAGYDSRRVAMATPTP